MTSHTNQNVTPLEDEVACKFVGDYLQVNAFIKL